MPVFSPITDWIKGQALGSALLNNKINTPLRELQQYVPRGVLADVSSTANTVADDANNAFATAKEVCRTTISLDTPRMVQAVWSGTLSASVAGQKIRIYIITGGGVVILQNEFQLASAGGPGQLTTSNASKAVALPAGTNTVVMSVIKTGGGSGAITILATAGLQVIDQGYGA